jgi:hypothetical protein
MRFPTASLMAMSLALPGRFRFVASETQEVDALVQVPGRNPNCVFTEDPESFGNHISRGDGQGVSLFGVLSKEIGFLVFFPSRNEGPIEEVRSPMLILMAMTVVINININHHRSWKEPRNPGFGLGRSEIQDKSRCKS